MHDAERIAIWIILGLIIFWIMFRQTSEFTIGNGSLLDLEEFRGFPKELKIALKNLTFSVTGALGTKFTTQWDALQADQKAADIQKINTFKNTIVNNINSAPNLATALSPLTHANAAQVITSPAASQTTNITVSAGTINSRINVVNPPVNFNYNTRGNGIGFIVNNSNGTITVNTDLITNFTLNSGNPDKFTFVSLTTNQTMPKPPPV